MVQKLKDIKEEIACGQIRLSIMALFCLTVIAIGAMIRVQDPENIVINIIVAISSFSSGVAAERTFANRKTDKKVKPLH